MGEAEKERLARLNEFNGKVPPAPAPRGEQRRRRSKTEVEVLEEMFDRVVEEISEREEFLASAIAHGKGEQYTRAIKTEIQARTKQLQKLDGMIRDAGARAGGAAGSS